MGKKKGYQSIRYLSDKMKKLLFTILFLCCLQARAEVVKKIDIEGNSRISDETIKVYGDIILNKDYSQSDTNLILKKLYETDFFETVDVNLSLIHI